MDTRETMVVLAAGFVGWMLCFATMGVGMATLPLDTALVVHAIAAPILFGAVSLVYFSRFSYTGVLATAAIFVGVVIVLGFFVAALLINRSPAMFASPIGTWILFGLIVASTYLTGRHVAMRGARRKAPAAMKPTPANLQGP